MCGVAIVVLAGSGGPAPLPTCSTDTVSDAAGGCHAQPTLRSMAADRSTAVTLPSGPTASAADSATKPVPAPTSSTDSPTCSSAIVTTPSARGGWYVFPTSYCAALRSNCRVTRCLKSDGSGGRWRGVFEEARAQTMWHGMAGLVKIQQ